jgi:hypothetical protein
MVTLSARWYKLWEGVFSLQVVYVDFSRFSKKRFSVFLFQHEVGLVVVVVQKSQLRVPLLHQIFLVGSGRIFLPLASAQVGKLGFFQLGNGDVLLEKESYVLQEGGFLILYDYKYLRQQVFIYIWDHASGEIQEGAGTLIFFK